MEPRPAGGPRLTAESAESAEVWFLGSACSGRSAVKRRRFLEHALADEVCQHPVLDIGVAARRRGEFIDLRDSCGHCPRRSGASPPHERTTAWKDRPARRCPRCLAEAWESDALDLDRDLAVVVRGE